MPTATIGPDENIRMKYRVPRSGMVEFEVEADHPVKTYILRPKGLELFDEGERTFKYYGGYQDPPRKVHRQELVLPFDGPWYLVIINPSRTSEVEVHYEVYY